MAKGRIDALSSSDIKKLFDDLVLSGERILIVDMTAVHYVSSAGLRIFIATQKELKKVGGEIILSGLTEPVLEVFNMSGLVRLFRTVNDKKNIPSLLRKDSGQDRISNREIGSIAIKSIETDAGKGSLFMVGSQDRAADSSYTERDVVAVKPADMKFGCGLAALGNDYDEYCHLFGESMVINNTFFFYPAVKHPSVDFLINAHQNPGMTYKFFHGFGFTGEYRYILSFQGRNTAVELPPLIDSFFDISRANVLGIAILAESSGFWGMNIKRVPVAEKKPDNGKSIFDSENFPDWIDFPVEPSYLNNIVAATGIAVRDRAFLSHEKASLVSEGSRFHLHGGVFDKAPIGSDIADFDKEMLRVFNEHPAYKIQHILRQSRFSGGMAAIVEIGD
jgi:anti-anti-sigma factor